MCVVESNFRTENFRIPAERNCLPREEVCELCGARGRIFLTAFLSACPPSGFCQ